MVKRGAASTTPVNLDAVFKALADPTRRAIVEALAGGPATVTSLASPFDMTLPAVLKHLHVLEGAGLVAHARVGRERRCALVAGPLGDADAWLRRYRTFWRSQLASLDAYLHAVPER